MAKNVNFESVDENDAIIARIKEFIPNLFGLIFAYFIGYYEFSMAWIVTPLVIVLLGTRWRQERDSNKAENKELKKNFAELDLNGDGVITLTELKTGIEKKGQKFQKEMFDLFDRDGNGVITLDEYIQTCLEMIEDQKEQELLERKNSRQRKLRKMSTINDKYFAGPDNVGIGKKAFGKVMSIDLDDVEEDKEKSLRREINEKMKKLREEFAVLDKNGSGNISLTEMKAAVEKKGEKFDIEMFSTLDRNKDSLITVEEYIQTLMTIKKNEAATLSKL